MSITNGRSVITVPSGVALITLLFSYLPLVDTVKFCQKQGANSRREAGECGNRAALQSTAREDREGKAENVTRDTYSC